MAPAQNPEYELTPDIATEKLLKGFQAYYNVETLPEESAPLIAICEYYERSQKYVLSQKAELWSENSEEFLFLYKFDQLTLPDYEKCKEQALAEGMKRAHIGPGHMYTYITPIFVCDRCEEAARKALQKTRIYKSFRFSFHGWMDFHTAVLEVQSHKISSNGAGRPVEKAMKKMLFDPKKIHKKEKE